MENSTDSVFPPFGLSQEATGCSSPKYFGTLSLYGAEDMNEEPTTTRQDHPTLTILLTSEIIKKNTAKYADLELAYDFVPIAVETAGVWGSEALSFVKEVGRRMRERGCDPRSGFFLAQQISLAIQRGNAAGIMGTFGREALRGGVFD